MMAAHARFTMKGSPSATCTTSIAACAAGADMTSATAAVATTPATAWKREGRGEERERRRHAIGRKPRGRARVRRRERASKKRKRLSPLLHAGEARSRSGAPGVRAARARARREHRRGRRGGEPVSRRARTPSRSRLARVGAGAWDRASARGPRCDTPRGKTNPAARAGKPSPMPRRFQPRGNALGRTRRRDRPPQHR